MFITATSGNTFLSLLLSVVFPEFVALKQHISTHINLSCGCWSSSKAYTFFIPLAQLAPGGRAQYICGPSDAADEAKLSEPTIASMRSKLVT